MRYLSIRLLVSMENYYFLDGDHRRGPFSLDQLKTCLIAADTPIWKDSRNEWVPAAALEEVKNYVQWDLPAVYPRIKTVNT
jgi:hypothetical protein